ncbi:MAG: BCCT family transporter [Candidatus Methanofastidiosum sp.]|nr:BCCT family transporter [Methanofastidiosum sp.]
MNLFVSVTSGVFILIFALYALLQLDRANKLLQSINSAILTNFDWVFILSSNIFLLICIGLALSKLGNVRIGGIDSVPEFSKIAWYSMLISAGMGIGLMFWAVGEPLTHFINAPPIFESADPAVSALASTFLHWGLHPWGIYTLIGLGLAYFAFNRKLPLSIRSVFYPFLKDKIYGIHGDIIDTFAVLATMFGLATSLGLGTLQINSGLDYIFNIGVSTGIQVGIIIVVTLLATVSVMAGIHKGVRFLSEVNMRIAFVFMMLIFLLGPTTYILRLFVNSIGVYFGNIVQYATFLSTTGDSNWQGAWTIFYLAWWISWSPFVGMFIARISKGRTIREFIVGVLFIPSLISFFWLSVFGGSAIFVDGLSGGSLFQTVQDNYPVALFEMINLLNIPLAAEAVRLALFVLITLLVMTFFITSSDSGSLVVNKLTSSGVLGAPKRQRVFWALLEGVLAATLLIIGGELALETLQTAVIIAGLPLAVVLFFMSFSLIKGIGETYEDQHKIRKKDEFWGIINELGLDVPVEDLEVDEDQEK